MIYRAGVFVREIEETNDDSVYDYNFKAGRVADRRVPQFQRLRDQGGHRQAVPQGIGGRVGPGLQGPGRSEAGLRGRAGPHYICPSWETPKEEQQKNWQQAWQAVAGDAVLCGPSATIAEFVERKGHIARPSSRPALVEAAARFGIKTDAQVLTENEKKGREKLPATPAAEAAVDTVWGWLTTYKLTNGTAKGRWSDASAT